VGETEKLLRQIYVDARQDVVYVEDIRKLAELLGYDLSGITSAWDIKND